jgi:hypothetical protein
VPHSSASQSSPVGELVESVFSRLRHSGACYAVIRNFEGYPSVLTGDIDLLVAPDEVGDAVVAVEAAARTAGYGVFYSNISPTISYVGLVGLSNAGGERCILVIELFSSLAWRGLPYLPVGDVLASRVRIRGMSVLPLGASMAVTVLHHLVNNLRIPDKYSERIASMLADPEEAERFEDLVLRGAGTSGPRILEEIRSGRDFRLTQSARAFRRDLVSRHCVRPRVMFRAISGTFTKLFKTRTGVALTVNVAEGAESLLAELERLCDEYHVFQSVARRFRGRRGVGAAIESAFVRRLGGVQVTVLGGRYGPSVVQIHGGPWFSMLARESLDEDLPPSAEGRGQRILVAALRARALVRRPNHGSSSR